MDSKLLDGIISLGDDLNYSCMFFDLSGKDITIGEKGFFENRICDFKVLDNNIVYFYIRETTQETNVYNIKDKVFDITCSFSDRTLEKVYDIKYQFKGCVIKNIIPTKFIPNEDKEEYNSDYIFTNPKIVIFRVEIKFDEFGYIY